MQCVGQGSWPCAGASLGVTDVPGLPQFAPTCPDDPQDGAGVVARALQPQEQSQSRGDLQRCVWGFAAVHQDHCVWLQQDRAGVLLRAGWPGSSGTAEQGRATLGAPEPW